MSTFLDAARPETPPAGTARFRPAVHFTARDTWLNDPNGLVFHDGLYHLFFQNNPYGNVWGNMSWGHATSRDLLHWTEHPVAIACDESEDIFSGSVVVDHGNTSGFGTADAPALVAIYTSAYKAASEHHGTQAQSLAYSTDAGMTWHKYGNNPVLARNSAHFRDPKVFRYEGGQGTCWIMVAVEAQHQKVVFYRSDDLKTWDFLSDFGPMNADQGEWECPDLFPLAVDGDPDNVKWVLIVNVNPGAVAGGSGGQYFVGQFDGARFVPDASSVAAPAGVSALGDSVAAAAALQQCLWLDWGRDCYASVSFSNVPDGRRNCASPQPTARRAWSSSPSCPATLPDRSRLPLLPWSRSSRNRPTCRTRSSCCRLRHRAARRSSRRRSCPGAPNTWPSTSSPARTEAWARCWATTPPPAGSSLTAAGQGTRVSTKSFPPRSQPRWSLRTACSSCRSSSTIARWRSSRRAARWS
jgi:sucrose-6-phosphate hydrolase SacC (GH32 family)